MEFRNECQRSNPGGGGKYLDLIGDNINSINPVLFSRENTPKMSILRFFFEEADFLGVGSNTGIKQHIFTSK